MKAEIVPIQPELFDDPAMYSMRTQIAQIATLLNKATCTLDKVRKSHWAANNEQNARLSKLEEDLEFLKRCICKGE